MNGTEMIAAERKRQIDEEGYNAAHDQEHQVDELVAAGICYFDFNGVNVAMPDTWPWDAKWWKPKDRRRNLVRAGALFLAAADRGANELPATRLTELRQMVARCAAAIDNLSALVPQANQIETTIRGETKKDLDGLEKYRDDLFARLSVTPVENWDIQTFDASIILLVAMADKAHRAELDKLRIENAAHAAEIARLKTIFRVNVLRLRPETTHAKIDDALRGTSDV